MGKSVPVTSPSNIRSTNAIGTFSPWHWRPVYYCTPFTAYMNLLRMRVLIILVASAALSACNLIYKLPTRQGNVIEQKQLDKLEVGMTREQVKFLLGTPLAASPFRDDRWDYVGYYKSPRGKESARTVSLYFDSGLLARMEGVQAQQKKEALEEPDVETILEQEKKDNLDSNEPETGVVIEQEEA